MDKRLSQWVAILTLAAMLIGAGIWLGKLQQRVDDDEIYYHGGPAPAKGQ